MDLWLILILLNATRSTKIAREFTTRKLIFINSPKSFCITIPREEKTKSCANQDSTNIIALRASMRLYQRFELIVESSRLGLKVRELSLISI